MGERASLEGIDHLLLPLLGAGDEARSQSLLSDLVYEHAEPIIRSIVKYKLRLVYDARYSGQAQEAEDICGNAILGLLARLREFQADPQHKAISSFRNYAATVAHNAFHEYLRSKYPQRYSLKNRLRYVFSHHRELALWEGENEELLCGLAGWQAEGRGPASLGEINRLRDDAQALHSHRRETVAETAVAAIRFFERPVELDDLVCIVAEAAGIKDAQTGLGAEREPVDLQARIPDKRMAVDEAVELRAYITRLWEEICRLPLRQRAALLLNLKDGQGNSRLEMFWLMNVATIRQIARALEMTDLEFAQLLGDLPLEDAKIAERLGLTRQQIINLRKSARERLARRLKTTAQ
ncbi:MAG TPA: sigma-70 family RNA polymerase sigma factor [Blastocatellia bacterium]|nr:sigma-70 family RNA polymerase sigma factor [Blastocatellia bacterium]